MKPNLSKASQPAKPANEAEPANEADATERPPSEWAHLELDALRAMLGTKSRLEEHNVPPQDDEEDPG